MKIEREEMSWWEKHADMVVIMFALFTTVVWMNDQFSDIKKDLAIIKAVVLMK